MGILGKRIISAATVGALLLSAAGCKDKYEGERISYDTVNFRFTVDDNITVDESVECGDGIGEYDFVGGDFISLNVEGYVVNELKAKANAEYTADYLKESDSVENIKTEVIKDAPYECAAVHYTDNDFEKSEGRGISEYYMTYQSRSFKLEAHYDTDDKKAATAELERIMLSAEYISDYFLPTEPQTYTTDYFSVNYEPKWKACNIKEEDITTDVAASVNFCYAETDDPDKYIFPQLKINVYNNGGSETAEDMAYRLYKRYDESSSMRNVTLVEDEILGYTASVCSYALGDKTAIENISYYIDLNGMVYCISMHINEDSEDDMKDMNELLEGITLKELSDEKIAEKLDERNDARYSDYVFHDAYFTIDSTMEADNNNVTETGGSVLFSGYNCKLTIEIDEDSESAERERENTIDFLEFLHSDYDEYEEDDPFDFYSDELEFDTGSETIGEYELPSLIFEVPDSERCEKYYFLKHDENVWEFCFNYDTEYEDDVDELINDFFNSLKFTGEGEPPIEDATEILPPEDEEEADVPDLNASDGNMYQTFNFSFSVPENVTYTDHEDKIWESIGAFKRSIDFSCSNPELEICVYDTASTNYSPELYMETEGYWYEFDENGWEVINNGTYDIGRFCSLNNDEENPCDAIVEVFSQGQILIIWAKCGYDERAETLDLLTEIADTAKYIGEYTFPEGVQTYEGEYFSISCEAPFEITESKEYFISETACISYSMVDEFRKAPSGIEVNASENDGTENAEDAAESDYSFRLKFDDYENLEKSEEFFRDIPAYTVTYTKDYSYYNKREKRWYFDKDDVVYEITASWQEGDGECEAEVMRLIDNLKLN